MDPLLHFPKHFPVLLTERLLLRPVHGTDVLTIYNLYSDREVMKFHGVPTFAKKKQADELIFHWRKLFATENGMRWGIVLKEKNKLIGTLGFKTIAHQHRRGDAGYDLDPLYWNKGIMTEAMRAVCTFAFEKMNLHSIEANISPDHVASKRVLEKNGFTQEGLFRRNFYYQGWWDSAIWSLEKKQNQGVRMRR